MDRHGAQLHYAPESGVVGTRAQLVKVAPVLTLAAASKLKHVVWFTGQHNESIDDLIADFAITSQFVRPDKQQERSSVICLLTWFPGTLFRCWRYIGAVRKSTASRPLVVVHGDTLSTYLGALAARFAPGDILRAAQHSDNNSQRVAVAASCSEMDFSLSPGREHTGGR